MYIMEYIYLEQWGFLIFVFYWKWPWIQNFVHSVMWLNWKCQISIEKMSKLRYNEHTDERVWLNIGNPKTDRLSAKNQKFNLKKMVLKESIFFF